ncbi:MAG: SAM-dependent methyltransferase [Verrucomicrobia bacterium]|nr:SAM-dependent methyltransferase [Verrucomicrobiota bacterium]
MAQPTARDRFLALLQTSVHDGTLVKLTLGKHRGADASLKNIFVRPVALKTGQQLSFVYRHATRDITKNLPPAEALAIITHLIGSDFLDAHLFTPLQTAQLEIAKDGQARISIKTAASAPAAAPAAHDREREYLIPPDEPWLQALGITNDRAQPREGMSAKFRQINKFIELLSHLTAETTLPADRPFRIVDMGCGKGYLTFAAASYFGQRAEVLGIEARPELVAFCQGVVSDVRYNTLQFSAGTIAETALNRVDVLIALHACDTATDDAIAKGIAANAALIVVSPCCQKELRPQLTAPPILADALKHGIFQERQAEFVTDALRALLLEWAGYRTKVFEFISTEHTAKNLMIAAIKEHAPGSETTAQKIRDFARFYGIRSQKLASHLGVDLQPDQH